MDNFINTAATDISRARTVGLNQLTPEPFPVLVVGTRSTQSFIFASRGTLESWSGDATYSLRLTIADVTSQAIAANFTLAITGGATLTLPFDLDAAGLQNALNSDATVGTTDGGVYVFDRGFGRYLIAYKAAGVPAALIASAALLAPDCVAELTTLTAGAPGVRQLMLLTLRFATARQTTAFSLITTPYAGWTGVIDLTGSAAQQLIWIKGQRVGEYLECQTMLTLEVIDLSGNATPYYQTAITLRALNYMDTTTLGVGPTRNAQTITTAGSVAVAPASQVHTERLTFTGAGTRNVVVATTGLVAGAHVDLSLIVSGATNGMLIKVYAVSTSGTELVQFTKAGGDTNAFFALRADGAGGFNNVEQLVPAYTDA